MIVVWVSIGLISLLETVCRSSNILNASLLSFGTWMDNASILWSPNDRIGAFDFHGPFNPDFNLYDPVTLSKAFILPPLNATYNEQNKITLVFSIWLGCSVDEFENVYVNATLNDVLKMDLVFNSSHENFVESNDNPYSGTCSWHTAGNLENQIWRGDWNEILLYNKTEIDANINERILQLYFFTDFNHDTRDEFWLVGNVSLAVEPLIPTASPTGVPTAEPTVGTSHFELLTTSDMLLSFPDECLTSRYQYKYQWINNSSVYYLSPITDHATVIVE